MPELPEVEITARLLDSALRDGRIESALAPGINALKTFDPPLEAIAGERVVAVMHQRGRSKGTGVQVDMLFAQVWTLRGGEWIRMDMYSDPSEALKAVGLAD